MSQKTFQLFIAISVVLMTSAVILLLLSGLVSAYIPLHTDGIIVVAGGIGVWVLKVIAALVLIIVIVVIAAALRALRPKLR